MQSSTPFRLRRINRARARVYSGTGSQIASLRVNRLLHERKISAFDTLSATLRYRIESQVLQESKSRLLEAFVQTLRFEAHPATFFPEDILSSYRRRNYLLLLEPNVAEEVLRLWGRSPQDERGVNLGGYQLNVLTLPVLAEESYLVAEDKYCVYVYPRRMVDGIRVYRSEFVDLTRSTPPPLTFHSQDVLDGLQEMLAQQLGLSPESIRTTVPERPIEQCPQCGGKVQHLGGKAYFCLECDWDNLEPLPPEAFLTDDVLPPLRSV